MGILQKTKVVGSLLAQYEGYRGHKDVSKTSDVPTFASIQVAVEGWEGVPVFLESGKALMKRDAAVQVLFNDGGKLFINIHDGSSVYTSAEGQTETLVTHSQGTIGPYGMLLLDAFTGNQSNFVRTDEVQAEWDLVAPLLDKPSTKTYLMTSDPESVREVKHTELSSRDRS